MQPPRSLAHGPIYQAMLTLDNTPDPGQIALPGLRLASVATPQTTTQTDLSLSLNESEQGLIGYLEYASDLFDAATVARFVGYFETMLAAMVDDDRQQTARIALLSAAESGMLLHEFNATTTDCPRDKTIHRLFEERAACTPQALALQDGVRTLDYGQLNGRANQLAQHLAALGVTPGVVVALALERSAELVIAQLAILKAGGVYLPLDDVLSQAQRRLMIVDSGASLLLILQGAEQTDLGIARIEVDAPVIDSFPAENLPHECNSEAPAYVMYTSGSTGVPKGVLVPHRAVVKLVIANGYLEFCPSDRVAFAANPAFDATTMEIWGPLLNGGALVVIDRRTLLAPERFTALLIEQKINVLWLTVGLFNQYAEALAPALPTLRYLLVGGDALDTKVMAKVLRGPRPHMC